MNTDTCKAKPVFLGLNLKVFPGVLRNLVALCEMDFFRDFFVFSVDFIFF